MALLPPGSLEQGTRSSIIVLGSILLWGVTAGFGFGLLGAYHATPGRAGSPPDRWPPGTPVPLDRTLPTLLIFIHPRCPCSTASLAELDRVAARCRGRFAGHLIAYQPEGPADGPDQIEGRSKVSPAGLMLRSDPGGREAMRFGVETSGHVLLFDPSGRRLFSGGITGSRGHQGDNPGMDDLIAMIQGLPTGSGTSPVFGCPVAHPGRAAPAEVAP